MGVEPALSGRVRLLLWLMAFCSLGVGLQALFTPRSFYDDFPFGRGWVAMDGPYNEHLVRDVGSLNLAIVVLVFAALIVSERVRWRAPRRSSGSSTPSRTSRTTCGTSAMKGMAGVGRFGIVGVARLRDRDRPVLVLLWTPEQRRRRERTVTA